MSAYLSLILILWVFLLFIMKKERAIMFFYIFAFTNNEIQFDIGIAFKLYHVIILLYLPQIFVLFKQDVLLRKNVRPIIIDYILLIVLGLIFGFLFKFDDPYEHYRLFTQRAEMRTFIGLFRIFIELFSIVLVYYWFRKQVLTIDSFVKTISMVVIINLSIAVFFYVTDNAVYKILFPQNRLAYLSGRISGLNGEKKTFGVNNAFILIFLLYIKTDRYRKLQKLGILSSLLGVLLSMSASAYITSGVALSVYALLKRNVPFFIIAIAISSVFVSIAQDNTLFQNSTLKKIRMVLVYDEDADYFEKVKEDEPKIFTRFQIFDRAAINFFHDNPEYLLFGVGPNLISIPASDYLTDRMKNIDVYSKGLNTVPFTFLVNTISKTGIVGLMLWLWFFMSIFNKLKQKELKYFWITMIIMNFITASNLLFLYTGFILFVVHSTQIEEIKKALRIKYSLLLNKNNLL